MAALQRSNARGELAISAFTVYELGIMLDRGKIAGSGSADSTIQQLIEGCMIRPVTAEIAMNATHFPIDFPRDPGDRIIAATARVEGIPLITADQRIQASKLIKTIW